MKHLAERLRQDLHDLAHETGIPLLTLQRAQAALQAAGEPGLAALGRTRSLDPALREHYRKCLQDWLDREIPGHTVQAQGNRFTIGTRLQLRFVPDAARWLLLTRRSGAWHPHVPRKACLSLTDWLNQVRQIVTSPSGRASFDTPRGL